MPSVTVTIIRSDEVVAQKTIPFVGSGFLTLPVAVARWIRQLRDCMPLRPGDKTRYEYKEN